MFETLTRLFGALRPDDTDDDTDGPTATVSADPDLSTGVIRVTVDSGLGEPTTRTVPIATVLGWQTDTHPPDDLHRDPVPSDVATEAGDLLADAIADRHDIDADRVLVKGLEAPNIVTYHLRPADEE